MSLRCRAHQRDKWKQAMQVLIKQATQIDAYHTWACAALSVALTARGTARSCVFDYFPNLREESEYHLLSSVFLGNAMVSFVYVNCINSSSLGGNNSGLLWCCMNVRTGWHCKQVTVDAIFLLDCFISFT